MEDGTGTEGAVSDTRSPGVTSAGAPDSEAPQSADSPEKDFKKVASIANTENRYIAEF